MAAIVRASHPISFQLLNRDRQPILAIFDGLQGQTLKLNITNSARRNVKPKQLAGNPTADNHHFEVRFRPGTLILPDSVTPNRPAITVEEAGWKISDKPIVTDGGVSFYLLITNPTEIESGKSTSVTLKNLSGDGKVGAHGTRVELKWNNNLEYVASAAGQSPEPLAPGHRQQHLSVVNESGQQHIPLHVGIVGNDKVLNNGTTVNELKLRLTNLVKPDPLKPGEGTIELNPDLGLTKPPATRFAFSFDFSPPSATTPPKMNPWALAFVSEVANIKIAENSLFKIDQATQTESPVWTITPAGPGAISIKPGDSIELKFIGIKTNHPSGLTNLYIKYKNVPGYWDGNFVAVIEKAPVIYKDQLVGVGTNDPKERLHVAGKLRVDNDLSVGEKLTVDNLRVEKDVSVGGGGVFAVDAPADPGGRLKIDTESKVTVKKLRVENLVSVGGDGVIAIDATGVSSGRVKIETDGKVGIGAATPEKHLHVAGAGNQEVMIQSTDGVKWSLQSSGSSGRFEVFNRTADQNRFTILKDGNVGIGTTTPGGSINTEDYFKPDKNGRMLEIHSPNNEALMNFSSNQDSDGAHIGGLYFTRTAATVQADAHRQIAAIKCKQLGGGAMGGGLLQFFTKPYGGGANFKRPAMVVRENGRVGIGTADPQKAQLQVDGWVNTQVTGYIYVNHDEQKVGKDICTCNRDYSIWAEKRIAADEYNAISDARTKNIQGRSDGAADLSTLLGIEITDYTYRDMIGKGDGIYKKLIGQQIEKVFPQAVSRTTDVVPDIYQRAFIRDGWVELATDLKKGERVKLFTETGEDLYEVLEVTDDRFRVDFKHEDDKVFVFGREVDDFLTVDYDAISMLNVSATQQLKKEMDQELKALRVENAELRAANDSLAKRLQLLESKLDAALGVMAAAGGSNGNGRH